jgi:hypothetical protein
LVVLFVVALVAVLLAASAADCEFAVGCAGMVQAAIAAAVEVTAISLVKRAVIRFSLFN